ncbi:hypothetical protein BHM03_00030585 [Ensete ventricosum]|nr:hypothetical protein BHM03_00030585 [Ensete ventricosum]
MDTVVQKDPPAKGGSHCKEKDPSKAPLFALPPGKGHHNLLRVPMARVTTQFIRPSHVFDGDPPVSPSFDPAAPAARGRRLPAAGDGVEGRCPGRHLLHNVRLLRQPLPARSSSPAAVTVHHRLPSAAVLHARHVLLLLPSAALRLHLAPAPFRRRLLLPSPDQHLLQGAAATQPLPTLLPILLLQPSPSLKLLLRCRPLPKSLVPLPLLFHSSPLRLPPVGVPFHNYPENAPRAQIKTRSPSAAVIFDFQILFSPIVSTSDGSHFFKWRLVFSTSNGAYVKMGAVAVCFVLASPGGGLPVDDGNEGTSMAGRVGLTTVAEEAVALRKKTLVTPNEDVRSCRWTREGYHR